MTLTATSIRLTSLPGGLLQLDIEESPSSGLDPTSTRPLGIAEIARKIGVHPKTVERRSKRKRNPLPLVRQPGQHPFAIERDIYHHLVTPPRLGAGGI